MNALNKETDEHHTTARSKYVTAVGDSNDGMTKAAASPAVNAEYFDHSANTYKQQMNSFPFVDNLGFSTNKSDFNSIANMMKIQTNNTSPNQLADPRRMSRRISFSEPIDVKQSNLRSDDHGELFAQKIQIRPKNQTDPKAQLIRTVSGLGKVGKSHSFGNSLFNLLTSGTESESDSDSYSHSIAQVTDSKDKTVAKKQYTVTLEKERSAFKKLLRLISPDEYSYSPNQIIVRYINWSFSSTFPTVFLSFTVVFFIMCLIFALFIKIAGDANPACIVMAGEKFGTEPSTTFSDSFHLSWTTFTTVGYGAVYTATGVDHANQWECIFITFLCTIESFFGLLYVGLCTAIIFGKVGRIQSHAQVSFSNVICIQYGNAAENTTNNRNEGDNVRDLGASFNYTQDESISSKITCPILKFQLVNKLANVPGGDILDAKIDVVGRREIDESEETLARYVNVRMQESTHPFFTRVWHCTHVLNKNSRLLTSEIRKAIEENDGFWPHDMLTPDKMRKTLTFDKIIITLTGISDLSAANVQIAKKYEIRDVLIGYDFAPMVYKEKHAGNSKKDRLKVDMSLLHDVIEQEGSLSRIEKITENTDDNNQKEGSLHFTLRHPIKQ